MSQLGVYTGNLNVLRTSAPAAYDPRLFAAYSDAFLAPLTGHSFNASTRGWVRTLDQLRKAYSSSHLICFEELQAGGAYNVFDSEALNVGREGLIALFRHRVLHWHGLNPRAVRPAARPRILLVHKTSVNSNRLVRIILNFDQVSQYVRTRFGAHADIQVTGFASMPLAEQLALVTSTSVAFSPCGGISMILPFLRHGAYAMLINYIIRSANPNYEGPHGECAVSITQPQKMHPSQHLCPSAFCELMCLSAVALHRIARGPWRLNYGVMYATSICTIIASSTQVMCQFRDSRKGLARLTIQGQTATIANVMPTCILI
jgi:hypothetical protein